MQGLEVILHCASLLILAWENNSGLN